MKQFWLYTALTLLVSVLAVSPSRAEDDFNPSDPPEPMVQYAVTIAAEPAEGAASITPGGTFSLGKEITISVTAASGYRFLYWTLNGQQYATSASCRYTVGDSAVAFAAHLAKNPTVTVKVSPEGAGSVYGGGTFTPGKSQRIYTYANNGYTFLYWTRNGEQYSTSSSFYYSVLDEDAEFVAVYQDNNAPEPEPGEDEPFLPDNPAEPEVYYQVSISTNLPEGEKPAYITSGGYFSQGKILQIITTPDEKHVFLYWTLNGEIFSENTSFNYTVGDSTAVFVAYFDTKQRVSVVASPSEAGIVSNGGLFVPGTQLLVSTTPAAGYTFRYWTLNGVEFSNNTSFYYLVGTIPAQFVAVYEHEPEPEPETDDDDAPFVPSNPTEPMAEKDALLITVLSADTTQGIVTGMTDKPLFKDDQLTITAIPNTGYHFVRWSDHNSDNPRTITATKDALYMAYFEGDVYTVTFFDEDSTTVLDAREWNYGQTPECIAPAKAEDEDFIYRFAGWAPQILPVNADACYYATYQAIDKSEVTALSDPLTSVRPEKRIENGLFVIFKNGVRYSASGSLLR